jgi:hypothetical protein
MSVIAYDLLTVARTRVAEAKRTPATATLPFPIEQSDAVLTWLRDIYGELTDAALREPLDE